MRYIARSGRERERERPTSICRRQLLYRETNFSWNRSDSRNTSYRGSHAQYREVHFSSRNCQFDAACRGYTKRIAFTGINGRVEFYRAASHGINHLSLYNYLLDMSGKSILRRNNKNFICDFQLLKSKNHISFTYLYTLNIFRLTLRFLYACSFQILFSLLNKIFS